MLTDHARQGERPLLLERLMEVVRPEFRADVFHPPQDSAVFFYGFCRVPACPIAVTHGALMLCGSHYQAWSRSTDREGGLDKWIAAVDMKEKIGLTACAVEGCNRSRKTQLVCSRHHNAWKKAGRPEVERWLVGLSYRPPRPNVGPEATCQAPGCERWTEGPSRLCRGHNEKWRRAGRGDLDTWIAELVHGENPRLRFDGIPRHFAWSCSSGSSAGTTKPSSSPQCALSKLPCVWPASPASRASSTSPPPNGTCDSVVIGFGRSTRWPAVSSSTPDSASRRS